MLARNASIGSGVIIVSTFKIQPGVIGLLGARGTAKMVAKVVVVVAMVAIGVRKFPIALDAEIHLVANGITVMVSVSKGMAMAAIGAAIFLTALDAGIPLDAHGVIVIVSVSKGMTAIGVRKFLIALHAGTTPRSVGGETVNAPPGILPKTRNKAI